MKAIILAAGRSRRLFPITHRKPKCLLPIGGVTLIDRLLSILKTNGLREVVMVVGFRARLLERHVREAHQDIDFVFVENAEYATTLPAYGLWMVREYLHEDVLYLNSDILCDPTIIEEVIKHKHSSVTAIQHTPWDEEEVNVVTDEAARVLKIGKDIPEEQSQGEFLGVTKLGMAFNIHLRNALEAYVAEGDTNRFAADALNRAVQNGGELLVHDVSKYTACEIDTIEDYENAKLLLI